MPLSDVCQQCKLSVIVFKSRFESERTRYGKLMQSKSGQAPKEMTERQKWIQDNFDFLKTHIRCKGLQVPACEPVHPLPQHITSPEIQPTQIAWRSLYNQTPQHSFQLQAPAQFPGILQSTSRSWTSLHR